MLSQKARLIRAKKLGVVIRNTRLAAGKDLPECARAIGVSPETLQTYEFGERSPSLPELELLAFTLGVQLERFWGQTTYLQNTTERNEVGIQAQKVLGLRQRMVGALVRKYRSEAGMTVEILARQVELAPAELQSIELGQTVLPVPLLESLAQALGRSMADFEDKRGPVGMWSVRQRMVDEFLNLPPELQEFVSKPVNHPYLEIARKLSEMPAGKLRGVAEGLLEITL